MRSEPVALTAHAEAPGLYDATRATGHNGLPRAAHPVNAEEAMRNVGPRGRRSIRMFSVTSYNVTSAAAADRGLLNDDTTLTSTSVMNTNAERFIGPLHDACPPEKGGPPTSPGACIARDGPKQSRPTSP